MSSIVPLQGDSAGRVLLSTAAVSSGGLPLGELLWDTTSKKLYANDQSTAGGVPVQHTDLLSSNDKIIIKGANAGTPVNHIQVSNRNTGAGPIIKAIGSDTSVALNLQSQVDGDILIETGGSGDVRLGRNGLTLPITKLGSVPAWTTDGGLFYHTTDKIWYYYDSTRAKFLSLEMIKWDWGAAGSPITAEVRGYGANTPTTATNKGYRIPHDCTIVGYTASCSAVSAPTMQVRNDTTSLFTFTPSTSGNSVDTTNVNMTAGDYLNIKVTAGSVTNPFVHIFTKRRR